MLLTRYISSQDEVTKLTGCCSLFCQFYILHLLCVKATAEGGNETVVSTT